MAKGNSVSHRQTQDLNPSPLTSNPDFLRNGCSVTCFPFCLSSQTESAALGPGGELGQGSRGSRPTPCSTAGVPLGVSTAVLNQLLLRCGGSSPRGAHRTPLQVWTDPCLDTGPGVPLEVKGLENREGRKTGSPELVMAPEGSAPRGLALGVEVSVG